MNPFENLVPAERAPRNMSRLVPGVYHFEISRLVITDDQSLITGEPLSGVEDKRCWTDKNPVLYLYLTCPEGVFHYRLYWYGYKKWADALSDPEVNLEMEKYRPPFANDVRQYLIDKATNTRVIDAKLTAYCQQIIQEFNTAAGNVGNPITELQDKKLYIELAGQPRNGVDYLKVRQISATPIVAVSKSAKTMIQPIQPNLDAEWTV